MRRRCEPADAPSLQVRYGFQPRSNRWWFDPGTAIIVVVVAKLPPSVIVVVE